MLAWPAEQVERGINKVSEDANQISNHAITKVSADLKMARSLVRLAEIQATLQEQRILFLRQQVHWPLIGQNCPYSHLIGQYWPLTGQYCQY